MFVAPMPHDDYINAVAHRLTELGYQPAQWWTESPDGEQLDGVIIFRGHAANLDLWPGKVYLGWDQHDGWVLCEAEQGVGNDARTLYPLDLDTFAAPEAVATRAADRLTGRPDTDVDESWDGAEALAESIRVWESND